MKLLLLTFLLLASCSHGGKTSFLGKIPGESTKGRKPAQANLSFPASSLGRMIDAQGNAHCTGTLVGECHIITAGSCLGRELKFVFAGETKPNSVDATLTPDGDRRTWALLRLKERQHSRGWMGISPLNGRALVNTKMTLQAFEKSSPNPKEWGISVARTDRSWFRGDSNKVRFSITPFSGIAGAPLVRRDEDGRYWIMGVYTEDSSPEALAGAVAGEAIAEKLSEYMDSIPCEAQN